MPQVTRSENTTTAAKMYVALELSEKSWKLVFSYGQRTREVGVRPRDLAGVLAAVAKARRWAGGEGIPVASCYEAGRDGFWLDRALKQAGIANVVLDASSIEVDRRARRAKTDRLDGLKLVALLERHDHGDGGVRCVRVPSAAVEDGRRVERELQRLMQERTAHSNRIRSLLALVGHAVKRLKAVEDWLAEGAPSADGQRAGEALQREIRRELERIALLDAQAKAIKEERRCAAYDGKTSSDQAARDLMKVRGIGVNAATVLSHEFFGWRDFANRRQVAGAAGLTPTPYASGREEREQGISKAGNVRVRWIAVQLAWVWLRLQPDSRLTRWYRERFGGGSPRLRKIGIVAVARRLLVDLWRYLKHGVVPEGAIMKA